MVLHPGTTFAGYTIIDRLGAGGMGEVYLVEHPRLRRRQALKIISLAGSGNDDFQRRFTNEARTAANLDHPNIITIHDFGVTDDTPWYSMSYLDGTDLTTARLTDTDIAAITRQVADALDHAHHHHVIHRDIKPANIVITRTPSGTLHRVVVLDFGIAKLANSTHNALTATNTLIGTLAYCAPEIIDGTGAQPRSDQYALACTVYQLLTGTTPFNEDSVPAIMMAHLNTPPPPLSTHRPDLAALDPVLTTAPAKNPHHRYPDCRTFAAALAHTLATTDTTRPDPAAHQPTRPVIHRPTPPTRSAHRNGSSSQRRHSPLNHLTQPQPGPPPPIATVINNRATATSHPSRQVEGILAKQRRWDQQMPSWARCATSVALLAPLSALWALVSWHIDYGSGYFEWRPHPVSGLDLSLAVLAVVYFGLLLFTRSVASERSWWAAIVGMTGMSSFFGMCFAEGSYYLFWVISTLLMVSGWSLARRTSTTWTAGIVIAAVLPLPLYFGEARTPGPFAPVLYFCLGALVCWCTERVIEGFRRR